MPNKGICKTVHVHFQGIDIWEDFLPIKLGSADIILGLQWLTTLGMTHTDWKLQTMTFKFGNQDVTIREDPSLGRSLVSLKNIYKTLLAEKNGFWVELIEARIEQPFSTVELPRFLERIIEESPEIFAEPVGLPPSRQHEHSINLQPGTMPISVRPYRYPHCQKAEIERLIKEMLAARIIQPSTSPFSSPVLLVKKKDGSW